MAAFIACSTFPLSAQNLLENPNFDLDASGWTVSGNGTATWMNQGSPTPGMIFLSATSTGPGVSVSVSQCVAIPAPAVIDVGARSYTVSSHGTVSTTDVILTLFSGIACTGTVIGTIPAGDVTFDPTDNWANRRALSRPLPAGTQSARVEMKAAAESGQMLIFHDTVVFGPVGTWGCVVWAAPLTAPAGRIHQPYSQAFTGQAGVSPYTFSLIGSLPQGLMLSSAGVLSGTPAASGTFPVSIAVRDVNGCRGERKYTIQVTSAPRRRVVRTQ